MALTLDAITLPDDLIWSDEFDFVPMQQQESYTLTGALIVETGLKQAGRPITLSGVDSGWITRQTLKSLYAKLSSAAVMVLTLQDARTFNVIWRNGQQPIEAKPVQENINFQDGDYYTLTIRLMQV